MERAGPGCSSPCDLGQVTRPRSPASFHPPGGPGADVRVSLVTEPMPMNEIGVIWKVFSEPQPLLKFTTLGTDFRIPRVIISFSIEPEFLPHLFLTPNPVTSFACISTSQSHLSKCCRASVIILASTAVFLLKPLTIWNLF